MHILEIEVFCLYDQRPLNLFLPEANPPVFFWIPDACAVKSDIWNADLEL